MQIEYKIPGKVLLTGEYAVLRGGAFIAAPTDKGIRFCFKAKKGSKTSGAVCSISIICPQIDKQFSNQSLGVTPNEAISDNMLLRRQAQLAWTSELKHPAEFYLPFIEKYAKRQGFIQCELEIHAEFPSHYGLGISSACHVGLSQLVFFLSGRGNILSEDGLSSSECSLQNRYAESINGITQLATIGQLCMQQGRASGYDVITQVLRQPVVKSWDSVRCRAETYIPVELKTLDTYVEASSSLFDLKAMETQPIHMDEISILPEKISSDLFRSISLWSAGNGSVTTQTVKSVQLQLDEQKQWKVFLEDNQKCVQDILQFFGNMSRISSDAPPDTGIGEGLLLWRNIIHGLRASMSHLSGTEYDSEIRAISAALKDKQSAPRRGISPSDWLLKPSGAGGGDLLLLFTPPFGNRIHFDELSKTLRSLGLHDCKDIVFGGSAAAR